MPLGLGCRVWSFRVLTSLIHSQYSQALGIGQRNFGISGIPQPVQIIARPRRFYGTKKRIITSKEQTAMVNVEFGGDFGNYKVVTLHDKPPRKKTPLRPIPAEIPKPDYYESGIPKSFSVLTSGGITIPQKKEPEIKTVEQIQKLRDSCKLARLVLDATIRESKIGVTTDELDAFAHNLIVSHGAYPSPLNYRGFPKSICTSVNNVACHGIPDNRPLADGDIVNVDVTVYLNGYHGDCSETVLIGDVDSEGVRLVEVTKMCLYEGISVSGPNIPIRSIGKAIESLAERHKFNVVPAFTGHGIGEYFHGPPDIYHVDYPYDGDMKPGMTFTIEPILSQGTEVVEIQDDLWTAMTLDNSRTAQMEHTILITSSGVEILTQKS